MSEVGRGGERKEVRGLDEDSFQAAGDLTLMVGIATTFQSPTLLEKLLFERDHPVLRWADQCEDCVRIVCIIQ